MVTARNGHGQSEGAQTDRMSREAEQLLGGGAAPGRPRVLVGRPRLAAVLVLGACAVALVTLSGRALVPRPELLSSAADVPVPLSAALGAGFGSEEEHKDFCERNGCAKFERRRRDRGHEGSDDTHEHFFEDATHDTFSNPMEDVAPMKEYECIRAQLSGIVNEAPQDTGPQLIFADSETAARGMARALGFSRELDGTRWTGDKNLGQALQSGLEEMRRELAEAVAANLCEETDPDERLKTCFTQTPANAAYGGYPYVPGCDKLSERCIKRKGYGSYDDLENLNYVLDCPALDPSCMPKNVLAEIEQGSYHGGTTLGKGHVDAAGKLVHEKEDGSLVDYGTEWNDYDYQHAGMVLEDFVKSSPSQVSHLNVVHVAALRLYTTSSYRLFNIPLRDRTNPHPIKFTVWQLYEGLRRLRAYAAHLSMPDFMTDETTWRGFKDLSPPDCFCDKGGTELGVMSTTPSLAVALGYANSARPLLMRLSARAMSKGADIGFLSVYPKEQESLYPPLTFLTPRSSEGSCVWKERMPSSYFDELTEGNKNAEGDEFTVIEVDPTFS